MATCSQPFYLFETDPNIAEQNSFLNFMGSFHELILSIYSPIATTISVFCLISNSLIMVILAKKEMRSVGVNVLMLFMSLLDLLVVAIKIVATISEFVYKAFPYPVAAFLLLFQYLNIILSSTSFSLAVIMAYCRVMALLDPNGNNDRWQSSKMAFYLSFALFCTIAILSIPILFCFNIIDAEEAPGFYHLVVSELFFGHDCFLFRFTYWLVGFVYQLIPSILLLIFSAIIVFKMRENLNNLTSSSKLIVNRTSRLVTATVTMSLITGLPSAIIYTFAAIFIQDYATYINTKVVLFISLLGLINCAITFPIYSMFSTQFRKLFAEMFIPKCFQKPRNDSILMSIFPHRTRSISTIN